jgi:hypothetical protein
MREYKSVSRISPICNYPHDSPKPHNFWLAGHFTYLPFTDTVEDVDEVIRSFVVDHNGLSLGEFYGDFGLGWYSSRDLEKFSLLAGYGRGKSSFTRIKGGYRWYDTTARIPEIGRGDFETYFVQASAPFFSMNSNVYLQLLLRSEYIRFRSFTLDKGDQPLPTAILIEPRMFFGAQFNPELPLQFEMQVGFQFKAGGRERFDFQPLHISLALMGLLDLW